MATIDNFEDIQVWQRARVLTREIYTITNNGSFLRDSGLVDQIRRACVSVMSNIAEGFERSGTKEFKHFLSIAKGSAGEVRSHLYVAFDQGYMEKDTFDHLVTESTVISKMLNGLISYLKATSIKGMKYR